MKFTMNTVKLLVAAALIVVVVLIGISSILPTSYQGDNLQFSVGGGPISITNPSTESIPVQLIGAGSRSFSVASDIQDVKGTSTKVGTGAATTQLFDFVLPAGTSEVTVSRGGDVKFNAVTPVELQATVMPVTSDTRRTTLIGIVVITLGLLFYMSSVTEHQLLNKLRGKEELVLAPVPVKSSDDAQGRSIRGFGDNRSSSK